MDRTSLHLEIRNALSVADELSRYEHELGQDDLSGALAAHRTTHQKLERAVGRSHADNGAPEPEIVEAVERALLGLVVRRHEVPRELASRTDTLLASAERVSNALWDPKGPVTSKPVLGTLPLVRAEPQDVHSILDYTIAAGLLASAAVARTDRARIVATALGLCIGGVSAATDCRLSVTKAISIEVHERLDLVGGIAAALAPFVLGYARKDPVAAALHVGLGLAAIATALVTDYRAERGITWPIRSRGGPALRHARRKRTKAMSGGRVGEAPRPLEGLSSAPSLWSRLT